MAWKCVFKNEISADTKIMDTRVKPEYDDQGDCFLGNGPRMTNGRMDTRVKPEYDDQGDSFLGNGPRMTNREASSLCTTQENTSHLSSSDLIGGSIKDGSDINNEVNINMVDTRVCALLCPSMTNGRMDTRVKPEYDKKKTSSLYQKEENTSHTSSSDLTQENVHPLSSLCMRKENTLNFSPLDTEQENSSASSSSDLIRRSTESKNDIDMDIIPNE